MKGKFHRTSNVGRPKGLAFSIAAVTLTMLLSVSITPGAQQAHEYGIEVGQSTATVSKTNNSANLTTKDSHDLYSLGNRVWFDTDADGQMGAEEIGISGVLMQLLAEDGNVLQEVVTDPQGFYLFENLRPATYLVRVAQDNWTGLRQEYPVLRISNSYSSQSKGTQPLAGYWNTRGGFLNPKPATTGGIEMIVFRLGAETVVVGDTTEADGVRAPTSINGDAFDNLNYDFGFVRHGLGDRVWLDKNRNGMMDSDEEGIAEVVVELAETTRDGVFFRTVATTKTTAFGEYHFNQLSDGNPITGGYYAVAIPGNQITLRGLQSTIDVAVPFSLVGDRTLDYGLGSARTTVTTKSSALLINGRLTQFSGANIVLDNRTGGMSMRSLSFGFSPSLAPVSTMNLSTVSALVMLTLALGLLRLGNPPKLNAAGNRFFSQK